MSNFYYLFVIYIYVHHDMYYIHNLLFIYYVQLH